MNKKTADYIVKKAMIEAIAEEYAKSSYFTFISFLKEIFQGDYIPSHIDDSELFQKMLEYNEAIKNAESMDEALS